MKPLRVKVPKTKGDFDPPPFLRLKARRRGITGKLTMRPVLRTCVDPGNADKWLTVSDSLKLAIKEGQRVTVEKVPVTAYRRYRLSRSAGTVFAAVATIIGATALTLGPLWPKSGLGTGLLLAGGALSLLAAAAVVNSAWKAPID